MVYSIKREDFINGVYSDMYVRFYIGHHEVIKISHNQDHLVLAFMNPNESMNTVNNHYNEHKNKLIKK